MNKIKCTCGKLAVWILLSGSSFKDDFKCDDCVPRACSCNVYPIDDDWDNQDQNNWKEDADDKDRLLPCCEWDYDKGGFDIYKFENDLPDVGYDEGKN